MRIALYGNYLFNLAVGLRENPDNDVQIFLDSSTLWSCLSEEPLLNDSTFVQLAPWVTHREILRPGSARITEMLADFDVALVTDLGSIFAASSGTDFVYLPAGSELTEWPFPIRSRSTRPRGRRDVLAAIIAFRLRRALRASLGVWGHGPYPPLFLAASRLGLVLDGFLPPAINAEMFAPGNESPVKTSGSEALTIFHPNRITFGTHPHLVEVGGSFGNDRLFRGFAKAVREGVDARLRLIEREGSPDEEAAKELLETLGVSHRVEWLNSGTSAGFTWPEMVGLYRECDIVGSELSGWAGLITLEGASCGKPVITQLDPDSMTAMYPDGHPFVQAVDEGEVCEAITKLADPELRRSVSLRSRQWILRHHDRSSVARRCESMLAGLGLA